MKMLKKRDFLNRYQKVSVDVYPHQKQSQEPLVSVCVPTYQHVNFIEDCLDGILMQKTDFPFEILLGEDDSTDGTRDVCITYAEKFPDKIRLFLNSRENNITIDGMPTGRFNAMYALFEARGKYIAFCEGDDYWTDPLKLQKQVNFLEHHPDFVICFHNVHVTQEDSSSRQEINYMNNNQKTVTTIDDIIERWYIMTSSIMFRNDVIKDYPDWFFSTRNGDYALQMMLADKGKIYFIDEIMGVWRKHSEGASNKLRGETHLHTLIELFSIYNRYSDMRYQGIISKRKAHIYLQLAIGYFRKRNVVKFVVSLFRSIYYNPRKSLIDLYSIARRWETTKFVRYFSNKQSS